MAKRLHEDGGAVNAIENSTSQRKKQKLLQPIPNGSDHARGDDESFESEKTLKEAKRLKKEQRRALKHARKEEAQKENVMNEKTDSNRTSDSENPILKETKKETGTLKHPKEKSRPLEGSGNEDRDESNAATGAADSDTLSKAERKALKRAKKAARKAAKTAKEDDGIITSGPTTVTASTAEAADLAYREHEKLTALSQSEIDAFVSINLLTIEDPLKQLYRPIVSFDYLHLENAALRAPFNSFSKPTPIQAACWPYLLAGRDVIGVAETGSGKTLAFALPCVQYISRLSGQDRKGIKACIVSPTRELAMQIHEQVLELSNPAGLKASLVYGGMSKDIQRDALHGTHILVATPGRLNDFIQEGSIDLSHVTYLVLDEADRMLDKGFEQEVRKIISTTAEMGRQTLMFTATWPPSVRDLAHTFMDSPVKVTIGDNASGELRANTRISQEVLVIEEQEKYNNLLQQLKQHQPNRQNTQSRILIFCLYKKEATRVEEFLRRKGFPVAGIHGDLSQQKRTESLEAFKQGRVPLLVATDVAARGLDIPAVKLVLNLTFPLTVEDYVHRIGRTGRAGSEGKAVTFFTSNEKALAGALVNVLKAAKQPVPEALLKFGGTVKKKGHEVYGAFYRDGADMKAATKITFD